ncbi:hypothetical protein CK203_096908 [Vitis vinifera]|uniref:MHD1 domain-containing protein n=1 Tax=Vitis vinifera TaxID=29760 RepID=A0A438D041_VITVI|nr:hypothetical protein CK203_096908 [Vitis vinifera]
MGHHSRRDSLAGNPPSSSSSSSSDHPHPHPHHHHFSSLPSLPHHHYHDFDLSWPFAKLDHLDRDDIRETAYEVFFTACRSSPGFGGRNALTFYSSDHSDGGVGGIGTVAARANGVGMVPTSRIKRALGLKTLKRSPSRRSLSGGVGSSGGGGSNPSSPSSAHGPGSPRLAFTLPAGRTKRPLTSAEIMRQQMRVTEQSDNRLRKTLMRSLVGQMGRRAETIILPLELLRHLKPSEFNDSHEYHLWQKRQLKILEAGLLDHPSVPLEKSNTFVMRLREIIRASESKPIDTGKNSDTMRILCNSVISLSWRTPNGSPADVCHWADGFPLNLHLYLALLHSIFDIKDETMVLDEVDELLELMKKTWSTLAINKQLHNLCFTWVFFHQYVATGQTEPDLLCAAFAMLAEVANDAKKPDRDPNYVKFLSSVLASMQAWSEKRLANYHETREREPTVEVDHAGNRVDYYIRSSLRNAFSKEKETFSPTLKRWHPIAAGVASVTLHQCYGAVLKQYLAGVSTLTSDTIRVLQRAGKLEKILVQMVVEDSVDCEDGGKAIVREMVPYEVDSVIYCLLKKWIGERLEKVKECLDRAKENETWNPKSKTEPYGQSGVELMKLAKETVEDFFEIPIGISDDLVHNLAERLEAIFQEYTTFVASCGTKQSYVPQLPPLTRCNRDSKFIKLWKKATPCSVTIEGVMPSGTNEGHHPRPSTSRGTQRLYIRLNTLHYLLSHIHSLDKTLSLSPRIIPSTRHQFRNSHRQLGTSSAYFDLARLSIQAASQHVSEVAAYRLIFLDSNSVFYESLYVDDVANARIRPALRILKQNLTLLGAILTDRAQALAIKKSDHEMIEEDFDSLKRVFCTCGEGLMAEDVVEREAETVEGVVTLMGQNTEQLMEDFSILACEASGIGVVGAGQRLPMPPTTGRWNRADPNTILRVLCYRNDRAANLFLKRTFQLAKRR